MIKINDVLIYKIDNYFISSYSGDKDFYHYFCYSPHYADLYQALDDVLYKLMRISVHHFNDSIRKPIQLSLF